MDRESGKRHGCVGNGMKKRKTKERERGGSEKKRAERIRVKSHFSKPQRVSTELADLPLEKCWGYRGV